ncbi:MAG: VOC family protein, partial [Pseudomonadota bacterium]
MEPRLSFVTLGVADLERSIAFYEKVLRLPRIPTPPTVAFFELGQTWLSLFARDSLAADAGMPAGERTGDAAFPGFSLAN